MRRVLTNLAVLGYLVFVAVLIACRGWRGLAVVAAVGLAALVGLLDLCSRMGCSEENSVGLAVAVALIGGKGIILRRGASGGFAAQIWAVALALGLGAALVVQHWMAG